VKALRKKPPKKKDRHPRWIRVDVYAFVVECIGKAVSVTYDPDVVITNPAPPGYRWLRCVGYLPPLNKARLP
jgi:hypothetical protein